MDLVAIQDALRTIEGVRYAEARQRSNEIIGCLTVDECSSLTPAAAMESLKRRYPRTCWPDRILLTFQAADAYDNAA